MIINRNDSSITKVASKSLTTVLGWQGRQQELIAGEVCTRGPASIYFDYAEKLYVDWPTPICIISDGPYGVSGFPGDNHKAASLAEWYEPHIKAWSEHSTPETTLWFWNTEEGWATVHPVLVANGWEYRCCNIWDKGLGHIAGNANTQTLRKFPVVTEVCVHYVKAAMFQVDNQSLTMQEWLRHEWKRTGLPFRLANEACGVLNAATRKYLTADHLWYYPPVDAFVKLAEYANKHGDPKGRPYFTIDGKNPYQAESGLGYGQNSIVMLASRMSGVSRRSAVQNAFRDSEMA